MLLSIVLEEGFRIYRVRMISNIGLGRVVASNRTQSGKRLPCCSGVSRFSWLFDVKVLVKMCYI